MPPSEQREPPPSDKDPEGAAAEETMADLFSRLLPQGGLSPDEMARRMGATTPHGTVV